MIFQYGQWNCQWPPLSILIGTPSIGPHQTKSQNIERSKKKNSYHRRRISRHSNPPRNACDHGSYAKQKGNPERHPPPHNQQLDRQVCESEHTVHQVVNLFPERPCGLTMLSRQPAVTDLLAPETKPKKLGNQGRMGLFQTEKLIAKGLIAPKHVYTADRHVRHNELPV